MSRDSLETPSLSIVDDISIIPADDDKLFGCCVDCSYDLVFSNWLLMYLEDAELRNLFAKLLCWLRPNGYFFFRESCYHSSGVLPLCDA